MSDDTLRDCFSPPISEIYDSARLLRSAVAAHLEGNRPIATELICEANMQVIGEWLDPLWLHQSDAVKPRKVADLPPVMPRANRHKPRHALAAMRKALIARDGHHCRFCGIPLVRAEVRKELNRLYPEAAQWNSRNEKEQHRGLQVMWLQYDHVVVHSRGGETTLENLVVACAACNFGRDRFTLEEMRLRDPRTNIRLPTWDGRQTWTGLELILPESKRYVQSPTSPFRPAYIPAW